MPEPTTEREVVEFKTAIARAKDILSSKARITHPLIPPERVFATTWQHEIREIHKSSYQELAALVEKSDNPDEVIEAATLGAAVIIRFPQFRHEGTMAESLLTLAATKVADTRPVESAQLHLQAQFASCL